MSLVLITREEADQRSLMHYRTKGSKNGVRRFQNEDGSLTPLGYQHYGIDLNDQAVEPAPIPKPMRRQVSNQSGYGRSRIQMAPANGRLRINTQNKVSTNNIARQPNKRPVMVSTTSQPVNKKQAATNTEKAPVVKKPVSDNSDNKKTGKVDYSKFGKAGVSAVGGVNKNGEIVDASGKAVKNKKDGNGKYYGKGNIDLNSRPVVKNEDGSISTERSFSINVNGKETLIPSVVNGKILSDDAAIDHFYETGEHLGQFDTVDEAEAYANMLHNRQDWYYNKRGVKHSDEDEDNYLMHYRTKGSKNGVRNYQREDGSLTPLGYAHYAAMYGWGKAKAKVTHNKVKEAELEAEKAQRKADRKQIKAEKARQKEENSWKNKTDEEIEKKAQEKIDAFNTRIKWLKGDRKKNAIKTGNQTADEITNKVVNTSLKALAVADQTKRAMDNGEKPPTLHEQVKNIRNMSDDDLSKALTRLNNEKRYAELLSERENREKGPVAQMASKLVKEAAENLARQSLNVAVNKVVDKLKETTPIKLADYKDVDPYTLTSDKLKAVSQAFNDAANLARNQNVVNNGGRDPNQGGGNNGDNGGNGGQQKNQQTKGNDSGQQKNQQKVQAEQSKDNSNQQNGDGAQLTKNQRKKMRAMANSGQSAAEIAKQLGVSESTVRQYAGEQLKNRTEQSQDAAASAPEARQTSSSAQKIDRTEQNRSYMSAASVNRKQLAKNLDTTARNVKRAEKFLDTFSKEAKLEADEKAKQERLKQFSDWVSGAEWAKEKVRIQTEKAKEEAERGESERQKKLKAQARMFGYRW